MNKKIIQFFISVFVTSIALGQPILKWEKSFGGSKEDNGYNMIKTKDGGYLAVGYTFSNDGDVTLNHDTSAATPDAWVVHFDSLFNIQWQRSFGGTKNDRFLSAVQTFDGGYALAGISYSKNGDLTMNHDTNCITADIWLVKLGINGGIQWQKSVGGKNEDFANALIQTRDSNLVMAGWTQSYNGDIAYNHDSLFGTKDALVIKFDTTGNILFQKVYGGVNNEEAYDIEELSDQSFVVIASASSTDGDLDSSGNHTFGESDFWFLKIDSAGTLLSDTCLGGDGQDVPVSLVVINDSVFVVGGVTKSTNGAVTGYTGSDNSFPFDVWLTGVSLMNDTTWKLNWNACYGGIFSTDILNKIIITPDSHLIVGGMNTGNGGMVSGNHGMEDFWCFEVDTAHHIVWKKSFGGSLTEICNVSMLKPDGNILFMGRSDSQDGNVSFNHGNSDLWIMEMENIPSAVNELNITSQISVFPNPGSGILHIRNPFNDMQTPVKISLIDVTGRTIVDEYVDHASPLIDIQVPSLASGMYFIQVYNGETRFGAKWIVD